MAKQKEESKGKTRRPTAEKRMIQNKKRRLMNRDRKSQVRTGVRALEKVLEGGSQDQVQEQLNSVFSLLDKAVKAGTINLNKASRTKSRLVARSRSKN